MEYIPSMIRERLEKTHCFLSNGKEDKIITECSLDCIVVQT